MRFGRVFLGLGLALVGLGLLKAGVLPPLLNIAAAAVGAAGMSVTVALDDEVLGRAPVER